MIEQVLALSWETLFWFGLKFLSAWFVAGIILMVPVAIVKGIVER